MDRKCCSAGYTKANGLFTLDLDGLTVFLNLRSNKSPGMQLLSSLLLPWEMQDRALQTRQRGERAVSEIRGPVCIADIVNRR